MHRSSYPSYGWKWWAAIYAVVISTGICLMTNSDYRAARELECGNRSTTRYTVYWDHLTDTCKKDYQNGTR